VLANREIRGYLSKSSNIFRNSHERIEYSRPRIDVHKFTDPRTNSYHGRPIYTRKWAFYVSQPHSSRASNSHCSSSVCCKYVCWTYGTRLTWRKPWNYGGNKVSKKRATLLSSSAEVRATDFWSASNVSAAATNLSSEMPYSPIATSKTETRNSRIAIFKMQYNLRSPVIVIMLRDCSNANMT